MNWSESYLVLIALILITISLGWQFGRRRSAHRRDTLQRRTLSPEYFRGLNFVLNQQPDEAIEIFIRMLDVDSETVDIHLALASLFRRRGEVDRAIRIHQNLMARPNLARDQHALALLELGFDYTHAGLLDRAEELFQELISIGQHSLVANQQLLDIYQQEKEWNKAIFVAHALERLTSSSMNATIAQFYCELADVEMKRGQVGTARDYALRALDFDSRCARASILEAELDVHDGKYGRAIKAYQRVEEQDAEYLPEVIDPLLECYRRTHHIDEYMRYLHGVVDRRGEVVALLVLVDLIIQKDGESEAVRHISKVLHKHPTARGVDRLLDLVMRHTSDELRDSLGAIKALTASLLQEENLYKCNMCGFNVKAMHWQCPGCKHWNTVKPVHGGGSRSLTAPPMARV